MNNTLSATAQACTKHRGHQGRDGFFQGPGAAEFQGGASWSKVNHMAWKGQRELHSHAWLDGPVGEGSRKLEPEWTGSTDLLGL